MDHLQNVSSCSTSQQSAALASQSYKIISLIVIASLTAIGLDNTATAGQAIAPITISVCPSCNSEIALETAAKTYFTNNAYVTPPGYRGPVVVPPALSGGACSTSAAGATILTVASSAYPISGRYYACVHNTKFGATVLMRLTGTTNAATITADALLLHRSAKTGPIKLPVGIGLGDTPEVISAWLSSSDGIPQSGLSTNSIWHAIANYPQFIQGHFTNTETGETFTIWNGDVVTVTDPATGNTAQFQWTPLSSVQWTPVPGSMRDKNGNPIGQSGPPSGAAVPTASVTIPATNFPAVTLTPFDDSLPRGEITVGEPSEVGAGSDPSVGGGEVDKGK